MTGFGNATVQNDTFSATVELKTVNNRFLKVAVRIPEILLSLEPQIERTIRGGIARGSVTGGIRFSPIGKSARFRIDPEILGNYLTQLNEVEVVSGSAPGWSDAILTLPGVVVDELGETTDWQEQWPLLEKCLKLALASLDDFRHREGESMQVELTENCKDVRTHLEQVAQRAPVVVSAYRDKIKDRVNELLADSGLTIEEDNVIREVAIFADRVDINEEITRLRCHIDEFLKIMDSNRSQGKKLDFLSQEMNREINTIGSKANDVEIAHHVIDMKAAVEKIREILQNVE